MTFLENFYNFFNESVESYNYQLISDNPFLFKYEFFDIVGNKYLVELKNIPVAKIGILSHVYELLYYVEDEGTFSVSKVVNVNPYRVLKTVFTDILEDFSIRCKNAKIIYLVGLAKEREKEFITVRTKVYKRYLDRNPPKEFSVQQSGNSIQLRRIK